jgi:hypothetical protein
MKLYSKVKLVRKSADVVYATPGALCHHIGYVMLVGGSKDYRYADVYFKNKTFTRCIRMFYNKNEDRYMYYDNDNNTKIYFHKELSENISEKSWVFSSAASAIQYEIEKYSKLEDFHNYQFVAHGPKASFCLVDDRHVSEHGKDSKEYKRMLANAQVMMRAHYLLNGFVSNQASDYFLPLLKGFDANLLRDFLPNATEDEMYNLYSIRSVKNDLVKNRKYELAAELRDYERAYIDIIKLKSLFSISSKALNISSAHLHEMQIKITHDLVEFLQKLDSDTFNK